jgi:hypothetical protein
MTFDRYLSRADLSALLAGQVPRRSGRVASPFGPAGPVTQAPRPAPARSVGRAAGSAPSQDRTEQANAER